MRPVRQTPSSSQNVNLTDHPIPQGLSDRRVDGPLAVISSAPVRMPELVRTEIGLLLLISIEIVSAIIQLSGFARQNPFMPMFGYETAASVAVLSTIIFSAGGGADCHWSQALRVKAFRTVNHWVGSVVCRGPLRLLPFAVLDIYTVSSASWVCCVWIDRNCRDSNFSDRNSTSDVPPPITNRKDAAMARLRHWTRNSNRF